MLSCRRSVVCVSSLLMVEPKTMTTLCCGGGGGGQAAGSSQAPTTITQASTNPSVIPESTLLNTQLDSLHLLPQLPLFTPTSHSHLSTEFSLAYITYDFTIKLSHHPNPVSLSTLPNLTSPIPHHNHCLPHPLIITPYISNPTRSPSLHP